MDDYTSSNRRDFPASKLLENYEDILSRLQRPNLSMEERLTLDKERAAYEEGLQEWAQLNGIKIPKSRTDMSNLKYLDNLYQRQQSAEYIADRERYIAGLEFAIALVTTLHVAYYNFLYNNPRINPKIRDEVVDAQEALVQTEALRLIGNVEALENDSTIERIIQRAGKLTEPVKPMLSMDDSGISYTGNVDAIQINRQEEQRKQITEFARNYLMTPLLHKALLWRKGEEEKRLPEMRRTLTQGGGSLSPAEFDVLRKYMGSRLESGNLGYGKVLLDTAKIEAEKYLKGK